MRIVDLSMIFRLRVKGISDLYVKYSKWINNWYAPVKWTIPKFFRDLECNKCEENSK